MFNYIIKQYLVFSKQIQKTLNNLLFALKHVIMNCYFVQVKGDNMKVGTKVISVAALLGGALALSACVSPVMEPEDIYIDLPSAQPSSTIASVTSTPWVTPNVTTSIDTPEPVITLTPTQTPVEYPSETPETMQLVWLHMPREGEQVALGQAIGLEGEIRSDTPIKDVKVIVFDSQGNVELETKAEQADLGKGVYVLNGYDTSITTKAPFSKLTEGEKCLRLVCSNETENNVVLWEANFTISEWVRLTESEIHSIFTDDLKEFFGNDDYLFTYKVTKRAGRSITISDEWTDKYIVSLTFNRRSYSINKLALDRFNRAFEYIKNSYVHFTYNDGTSGVFCLNDIQEYNLADGAFVPRFQDMSMNVISHHSFGTAIDLNSTLEVNKIKVDENGVDTNWLLISAALDKLSYEGLKTVDGRENVYCFKYDGNRPTTGRAVPDELVNYLWHELAFAREGFAWGGYFGNGSDAMHFSLTEPNDYGTVYGEGSSATPDRERVQLVFEYAP